MTEYAELFDKDFRLHQQAKVLTNKAAQRYDAAFSLIRDFKIDKALDVGCADGAFTERLRTIASSVYGIDVSKTAIEEAKNRYRSHFRVGDIREVPFPDESFDLVSCLDVIYYLDTTGRMKAVSELGRVLKRGGHLLISTSWPMHTKTRTGTSYMKESEVLAWLGNPYELIKEVAMSRRFRILKTGAAMLLRLKQPKTYEAR